MTVPPWLGTAAEETLCNFGTTGAEFAAYAAWASAYTGQIWGTVGFGAVSAALAAGSAAYGCYTGEPEQPTNEYGKICCQEWSNSTADVFWQKDDGDGTRDGPWPANVKKLVSWRVVPGTPSNKPPGWINVEFVTDKYGDGNTATVVVGAPALVTGDAGCMTLGMTSSGSCVSTAPDPEPIFPNPPDPISYTDPETGCIWNTTMHGAYLNAQGNVVIGYVATSADPDSCGGPIYWWEEPGKPPRIVQPDPRGQDQPIPPPEPLPCCDELKSRFNDVDKDLVQIMSDVNYIKDKLPNPDDDWDWTDWIDTISDSLEILDVLKEWLGIGADEDGIYPGVEYTLTGVCEEPDAEGNQPTKTVPVVPTGGLYSVIARVDALSILLQAHLGYKTPICNDRPKLEGDWVTAQWISDEASSDSPLRLRKRTRYRSKSGRSDAQLAEYFGSFTWEAGPVCVIHKGTWWGTPQVWARDADEGKRVIRHLAGEAGIDPDQNGEWEVSGSRNPRLGRKGIMRLRTIEGFPWVSSRNSSDMLPMG